SQYGCRLVADIYPGIGTMGGVLTALTEARFSHTLVVGCDTPLLRTKLLAHLAQRPRTYDALVPSLRLAGAGAAGGSELLQPLHTIYTRRCLPVIERHVEGGRFRVMDIFSELQVEQVHEDELRRFDPELHSFLNANTPDDFERVRSVLQSRSYESGQ
ncbi:MAG TPA: molybdenum cofactor guanylyltransferase, partial [Thermomicrobiaceae bacterium]|nr:molybdenum cofactor guanylyltransferase [Thermomicrobiaceae bacterium]